MKLFFNIVFVFCFCGIAKCQIQKYNYKSKLEPNSKLILSDYNSTLEKLKNGKVIYKIYYPENKMIIAYVTMKSSKSGIKDGLAYNQEDDGTLINRGHYRNDAKEGLWFEAGSKGEYRNGLKDGKWIKEFGENVIEEESYINGKLHGDHFKYDSLSNLVFNFKYHFGEKIFEEIDSSNYVAYRPARFIGCDDVNFTKRELEICSSKEIVKFLSSRLKYPKNARKQNVEGIAIAKLTIENNGRVSNIKIIRGLTIEIKNECKRVISLMPNWVPAMKNGIPIVSEVTFPIVFSLR